MTAGTAIAALLAICVAGVWLGCAGFLRLRDALDRVHCVAFVNVVALAPLAAAAFVTDGASIRAIKIALIAAFSLLIGAATSHVTGRALLDRDGVPEGDNR